jgi:hypothetical protein
MRSPVRNISLTAAILLGLSCGADDGDSHRQASASLAAAATASETVTHLGSDSATAATEKADNVCECPRPPGGSVRCSDSQLAVCRIVNGEAEGKCYDLPSAATVAEFRARIISLVLGRTITVTDFEDRPELQRAYDQRSISFSGQRITFSLPAGVGR